MATQTIYRICTGGQTCVHPDYASANAAWERYADDVESRGLFATFERKEVFDDPDNDFFDLFGGKPKGYMRLNNKVHTPWVIIAQFGEA
jgi:hypothetical protein